MKRLELRDEHLYSGHKALVSVRLPTARTPTWVRMTVDSGAEISVLNRAFAPMLGLTIEEGDFFSLKVASGDIAPAYRHDVTIDVLTRRMVIPILMCPEWDTENLLGMEGFFDQTVIAFDHARHRIYY